MKQVSRQEFNQFYVDNLDVLDRTPKLSKCMTKVSWVFVDTKVVACTFEEYQYDKCKFFVYQS